MRRLLWFSLLAVACSGDPAGDCATECAANEICIEASCAVACNGDGECAATEFCSGGACRPTVCGDGEIQGNEACDGGSLNADSNQCTSSCTVARCGDGLHYLAGEACDDGNNVEADGCSTLCELSCSGCDDLNPCTDESCQGTNCANTPRDDSLCDGNDAITCSGGVETGRVACVAGCAAGTCGGCAPNTQSCNGNVLEICDSAGALSEITDCSNGSSCSDSGVCDDVQGCIFVADAPDGTPCDDGAGADGDWCNSSCEGSVCTPGAAATCVAADSCNTASCDPGFGCRQDPIDCNDTNPCTTDSCVPGVGCEQFNNTDACEDADPCMTSNQCSLGSCGSGVPVVCLPAAACLTPSSCDPAGSEGNCDVVGQTALDFTNCDDGDSCMVNSFCLDGVCSAGPAVDCSASGGECAGAGSCDPAGTEGNCDVPGAPMNEGSACSDCASANCGNCVGGICTDLGSNALFDTAGGYVWTVPPGCTAATVKMWGAGGGGGGSGAHPGGNGGAGGYISAAIAVTPGENLSVTVGGGGAGGAHRPDDGGSGRGGGGAGRTQISRPGELLAVVGGGGGGGGGGASSELDIASGADGGAGGGTSGAPGQASDASFPGQGGTATTGGLAGSPLSPLNGEYLVGGEGSGLGLPGGGGVPDGGAGGGYSTTSGGGGGGGAGSFGGGGGGGGAFADQGAAGGGGGSSWTNGNELQNIAGSGNVPPLTSDPDYRQFAGEGGLGGAIAGAIGGVGSNGGAGSVLIECL